MSADPAFMDEDGSSGSRDDANMVDGNSKLQLATPCSGNRKRCHKATSDAIVDAMLQIAAASKMRADAIVGNQERFAISKCVKVLDEIHDIDQNLYLNALDLFENSKAREMFMSLKNERRLTWLQHKFSTSSTSAT